MRIRGVCYAGFAALFLGSESLAQRTPPTAERPKHGSPPSVFIEELTWPEVRDAMANGYTTALLYTGSTEANGPHLAIGKHTIIAHYVAGKLAEVLGNALVYPTLPFAPAHDPLTRSGLMAFPGTVSLKTATYRAVVTDALLSALAVGFRRVFVMGDHGLGQNELRTDAESLEVSWGPKGQHLFFIPDVYGAAADSIVAYLASHALPVDGHAGIDDTSELLYIEKDAKSPGRWVRQLAIAWADSTQFELRGIAGDPRQATPDLGRIFLGFKVRAGAAAIRAHQ